MKKLQNFRKSKPRSNKTVNRGNVVKKTKKSKSAVRGKSDSVFARRFVTVGVLVSVFMVGVSLFVTLYFNAEVVAKRKFEELARTYYEDYYYDKFMENLDEETKEEKLAKYEENGLQPVLLRQLLLYQNGKYSNYRGYFEKKEFDCDKNTTSAKFYPTKPYGKKDYRVEYFYDCGQ